MKDKDLSSIEKALGLVLPASYKSVFIGGPIEDHRELGLFDDPELIVARTEEYRTGFGGAPKWPSHLVYVGDQEDACPYILDSITGVIVQSDHGDPSSVLATYSSANVLIEELIQNELPRDPKRWWQFWR